MVGRARLEAENLHRKTIGDWGQEGGSGCGQK